MHKDIAVETCWYNRGAMQNSDDQDIFLLLHFNLKCNSRSYCTLCLINLQGNAIAQVTSCLLSKGGTGWAATAVGVWCPSFRHCPGATGCDLAPLLPVS